MKMLVCTDGSEHSKKAVKKAAKIAANYEEIEVVIIYVNNVEIIPMHGGYGESVPLEMQVQYEKEKEKQGQQMLQDAVHIFRENNIEPATILRKGNPSDEIIKLASEENFDLVVVGSRGLGGLKKIILGSVSNAVAQEAESDVLIIK
jgi:nucleotide-binding universal stress UspA family protein